MYKLVMKVIANRFKQVFPNYISSEQAGFIAGRNISDNILIAQEVIHSMRSRKIDRNWMAIKLDLEKAYDRISWDFIDVTLVAAGVPEFLRKLSRSRPFLSHIFFADDLVIFGKAEMDQAILLKKILKSSCDFSGHKNWEARKLSFAGRVTLAQSVLLAIPNYFMQAVLVLKGNDSFLMKIAFNLISQKDALWVRVLRSKYGWKNRLPDSIHRTNCSHIWSSLSKVWSLLRENLIWSIGDGSSIRSWTDAWIPEVGPLLPYAPVLSSHNLECSLRDWVLPDGTWNLDLVRLWLPEDIIARIVSIPPPHPGGGIDRIIWARSGSGSFSVRSTYWTLKESSWGPSDDAWKPIWKYQGPQRVCLFIWLTAKQRLLTNTELFRRGIGHSSVCSLCGHDSEYILHVLRDCQMAKEAWMLIVPTERRLKHKKVRIQSDNLDVVKALSMEVSVDSRNTVLRRIKRLLSSEGQWEIKYVPKECNLIIDQLAKIGLSWKSSLQLLEALPDLVVSAIEQDQAFRII
ncbi:hypothetical protein J1N35_018036 [Gossypium stocksii]|uniref:Reverse transcriptase domain-containing protein n=1 Tax=Gossypium stocksii TaxID=47602 RepID=A0A9D3VNG6_9ROSI|nr:hypothetical protein J1N35_018036 [Gossypium stocksii]